jgi:hypothetical protein
MSSALGPAPTDGGIGNYLGSLLQPYLNMVQGAVQNPASLIPNPAAQIQNAAVEASAALKGPKPDYLRLLTALLGGGASVGMVGEGPDILRFGKSLKADPLSSAEIRNAWANANGGEMGRRGQVWNAVMDDTGKHFWSASWEHHPDTITRLEEQGHTFTNPNSQGWAVVGAKPGETYVGIQDLDPHQADFLKAGLAKYPHHAGSK